MSEFKVKKTFEAKTCPHCGSSDIEVTYYGGFHPHHPPHLHHNQDMLIQAVAYIATNLFMRHLYPPKKSYRCKKCGSRL